MNEEFLEAELAMAEGSHPEELAEEPITEWLYDPAEAEREEIGLRGLIGAVEVLEEDVIWERP
uniref:hypothetical protein n=1 Tax=Herbidospora sakaeratensis TaxID=564415 RepID=UPI000A4E1D31|nr:hypothetical protein [Herbidospora sakaeratensis]